MQLFDRALELDSNNAQVREERYMLAHFVDIRTYWGADWTRVIRLLEDLYRIDPEYRNVQYLLQRAHGPPGRRFRPRGRLVRRRRRIHQRYSRP